jgi:ankyrin repeat protein
VAIDLTYEPSRAKWYRRHRWILIAIAAALLSVPLAFGARRGWQRYTTYRLQRQQKLDRELIVAAFNGDSAMMRRLLRDGASVNARYGDPQTQGETTRDVFSGEGGGWPIAADRWTPLIAVASSHRFKDKLEPAKLLVEAKANLDLDDGYGATALHQAVCARDEKLSLYFIERGANVNSRVGVYIDGPGGFTTLHRASGMPLIVKALLQRGANPNAKSSGGATPLHSALREADLESYRLMVEAGGDPDLKDSNGKSARELAEDSQYIERMERLNAVLRRARDSR